MCHVTVLVLLSFLSTITSKKLESSLATILEAVQSRMCESRIGRFEIRRVLMGWTVEHRSTSSEREIRDIKNCDS